MGTSSDSIAGPNVGTEGSHKPRKNMAMSVQPTYFVPRSSYYNCSSREYSVDDSISKAEYFSNAVLEDTYDQAYKSRVRDAELMRNANSTIAAIIGSRLESEDSGRARRQRSQLREFGIQDIERRYK